MITVILFSILSIIAFALLLYAFIDCNNPVWGNIFTSAISGVMFLALAMSISSGGVVADSMPIAVINETVLNSTDLNITSITNYQYEVIKTQIIEEGFAWIYALIAIFAFLMFGFMLYRIYSEPEESDEYNEFVDIGDDY